MITFFGPKCLIKNLLNKFNALWIQEIIETLKKMGHHTRELLPDEVKSVVQAIASECNSKGSHEEKCIAAVSDSRKGGKPDGF